MSSVTGTRALLDELRQHGCLRIKVMDPRLVHKERLRCLEMGLRLGNSVSASYRKPWLYVTLAGRISDPMHLLRSERVDRAAC